MNNLLSNIIPIYINGNVNSDLFVRDPTRFLANRRQYAIDYMRMPDLRLCQ